MEREVLYKTTTQNRQAFASSPSATKIRRPRATLHAHDELSRAHSIKFLSTRSVQDRILWCILWWSHDVVPRRAEGGRRKAEHRGAMSRGVHGTHTRAHTHIHLVFVARRNTRTLSPTKHHHYHERKAHTDAPPRLLNRALSLSLSLSIAGGVLMEAEICDLDELTSGQRRASLHSSASLNRCRLEGFVLTVQSFSCGRPLTSRGQVYKPGEDPPPWEGG